ncbi:MAG: hypothetical protein NTW29_12100 [Bacteroidetes bacterium]|nr:hypothetical protein [Bacteroidota bacterium]
MKKVVIVSCIFLYSCFVASKKTDKINFDKRKNLVFLYNYQTKVDSIGNIKTIYYDNLYLREERVGALFKFFLKDNLVFEGDRNIYQYLFEVFDESSLLISCVYGKSGAAGPDLFERDSVIIFSLSTATIAKVSLPKIYLTRSSDYLVKSYKCPTDTLRFRNEYNRYCAIDSIDVVNRKLILLNQCHQTEKFTLINL